MRDAARAACVSRASLLSWRCHPTLTFSNQSLGLNKNMCRKDGSARVFNSKVRRILAMHSGIGLKTLQIHIPAYFNEKDYFYLDGWLRTALKPGIQEVTLIVDLSKAKYNVPRSRTMDLLKAKYNFPCSILSNGSGESIRNIHLVSCSFRPAATIGCFKSLTGLHLCDVGITGEELECLLGNSLSLDRLVVKSCDEIVCLKVPCILQRLSYLEVIGGERLEAIDNKAPNVSSIVFQGAGTVRLSLGETLQMKRLTISHWRSISYARTKLPSMMRNFEALTLRLGIEV
jgi:hypothetical protein